MKRKKNYLFEEFDYKMHEVHFVRLFISAPTYDMIEKDVRAKLQDQLSNIGGNMGLLTGFSLISAVEILYFATKFAIGFIRERLASNTVNFN